MWLFLTAIFSVGSVSVQPAANIAASGKSANIFFIPSSPSYYCFDALVRGNSDSPINGTPASATVIWETYNTSEMPAPGSIISDVQYNTGKIYFHIASPFKEGNAGIAVQDANGRILWSWHIWCVQDDISSYTYQGFMNYNLGALSCTKHDPLALGLLYQCDRKDPFPGYTASNSSTYAQATGKWSEEYFFNGVAKDDLSAIPMTFVRRSGNGDNYYNVYPISELIPEWSNRVKNETDPCPAGWRVPSDSDFNFSTHYWSNDGYTAMNFNSYPYKEEDFWLPAAGCRYPGGLDSSYSCSGYPVLYWCSTPQSLYIHRALHARNSEWAYSRATYRIVGMPVRCIKE